MSVINLAQLHYFCVFVSCLTIFTMTLTLFSNPGHTSMILVAMMVMVFEEVDNTARAFSLHRMEGPRKSELV